MPNRPTPSSTTETAEMTELVRFLAGQPPFNALPEARCRYAARHMEIVYARKGTAVIEIGAPNDRLYLVRTGAVELHDEEGHLVERLGEGEYFGYPSLLTDSPARRRVTTIEDTLFYLFPKAVFDRLCHESEPFGRFFHRAHAARIEAVLHERQQRNATLTTTVGALLRRPPVWAPPDRSIRDAARQMTEAGVSSLLIQDDAGRLRGIVTDRDLRRRVVAQNQTPDAPISAIMTEDPVTIGAEAYAFEALLTMSRHNIHHLPVLDAEECIRGMITTTDLMRLEAAHPVYLVGEVHKQSDVEGLARASRRLPQMVTHLVDADARADDTTHLVTAVTDALTVRLLELAEDRIGPPPVAYAWMALGSQARREQSVHSDQDHALVLANDADLDAHDGYFPSLARFVADGLAACGYAYCPGEVMATTDRWRQPLAQWHRHFRAWIQKPSPEALVHASVFFDMRPVYGDASLVEALRTQVLQQTQNNSIFLASLTANALQFEPPLGFFRQFVLEKHGRHAQTLDLKHHGVVPVVDLARIYALAHGISAVNTQERLTALAETDGLNAADAANLRDAFEFIATVRLRHQVQQLQRGATADNHVAPSELSGFERRHLKDAFSIVRRMQSALAQRYQTSFIR